MNEHELNLYILNALIRAIKKELKDVLNIDVDFVIVPFAQKLEELEMQIAPNQGFPEDVFTMKNLKSLNLL